MLWSVFVMFLCLSSALHATVSGAEFDGERRRFSSMHAVVEITVPRESGASLAPEALASMAEAVIREANDLFSPKGDNSDVRRLNEAAPGEWVKVHPLTVRIVIEALRWHEMTEGMFDPTIGPLKRLFRFDGRTLMRWPSETEILEARKCVGAEKLLVDAAGGRLSWGAPGMSLDLGAIAKGFAADLVAEAFLESGVTSALVNVGGEMRVLGGKSGSEHGPWRVAITDPRGASSRYFVEIADRAVATSGDYESFFEFDGKRYSHIIDPRTGSPLRERVAGATVSHPLSAAAADALATVICMLGSEKAMEFFAERAAQADLVGVEAVVFEVADAGNVSVTHISVRPDGTVVKEAR